MERLNALNVGYLKKMPPEQMADAIFDVAINEINENWDEEEEIIAAQPEIVRVFYWVVRFSNLANYAGLEAFLNSESGYAYAQVIDSMRTIQANETADVLDEAFNNIRLVLDMDALTFIDVLKSQTLYELSNQQEIIYEIQDGEMALKAIEEPIYDYLIDYLHKKIDPMSDEEYI